METNLVITQHIEYVFSLSALLILCRYPPPNRLLACMCICYYHIHIVPPVDILYLLLLPCISCLVSIRSPYINILCALIYSSAATLNMAQLYSVYAVDIVLLLFWFKDVFLEMEKVYEKMLWHCLIFLSLT